MSKSDLPKIVTALFSFKGKNNDELCFRKGDVITVTQTVEGGWWEGTLNDKTAWFPSNYVKDIQAGESGHSSVKSSPEKCQESPVKDQRLNRDIVLKDLVDSERANVAELQGLASNFLQPLESTNVLNKKEYKQLIGNIYDVLEVHQRLLSNLEALVAQGPDARVGNLFLMLAPRLKSVHTAYCGGHPQAVCILDQYRDELNDFMERTGAVTPGILVLTTGLSKPFRRLDKYSAMLQELERHTEKNNSDRGDTQRSVCVYRDLSVRCAAIRKQKELALHVLTGGIKGWEGEELASLGDIIHVGPVTLAIGTERRDRYFVLFQMTLLVLSTSPRMSSFVYEGKLPLTGIDVVASLDTEDVRNAFEISGPMIESIVVVCPNKDERQHWIDLLSQDQQAAAAAASTNILRSPTLSHTSNQSNGKLQQPGAEHCSPPGIKTPWSLASLRPAPPLYSLKFYGKSDNAEFIRTQRTNNERQFEDDAIILKVIEGYCQTVNARFTLNSALLDNETTYLTRDRISVMNSRVDHWDSCDNRSLSETVETLKSHVKDLQSKMSQLTIEFDEERRSRLLLAAVVNRHIANTDSVVP